MAKTRRAVKTIEGDTLTITEVETNQSVSISLEELNDEIRHKLALLGLSSKVGDSYAGAKTPEEVLTRATATIENLKAGRWGVERSSGGGVHTTQLAHALSMATGKPLEECQAKLAEMEDEQKKALRAHPQIKAALAELRAKKAAEEAAAATPLNF